MNCERLDHLLSAYIDGDLPSGLNRRVSDHLDACERCQQTLVEQQRSHRLLDAGRRPVSIDLWPEFERRLQLEALRVSSAPRGLRRLYEPIVSRFGWFRIAPSPRPHFWQPLLAAGLAGAAVAFIAQSAPRPEPLDVGVAQGPTVAKAARVASALPQGSDFTRQAAGNHVAKRVPIVLAHPETGAEGAKSSIRPSMRDGNSVTARRSISSAHSGEGAVVVLTAASHAMPRLRHPLMTAHGPGAAVILTTVFHPTSFHETRETSVAERGPGTPPGSGEGIGWQVASAAVVTEDTPSDTAGPQDAAEGLAAVQQDAANEQVKSRFLLMVQEVARLGGAAAGPASPPDQALSSHGERT
jgi:anti-sigma factor RsiW